MRPVSAAFLRALRNSHTAITRVRVCSTYQTGTDPDGEELALIAGAVTLDATADVRATADVTTDGRGRWPAAPADLLAPYGNELYIERGVEVSGTREWVGLGYFRIDRPDQDAAPDGPIRLSGSDRMAGIVDSKLTTPINWLPGHTFRQAFERMTTEVYPDLAIRYDFNPDGIALGRSVLVDEDRYGFLADWCRSIGKTMYFDHAGTLVVASVPDPTEPVWTVDHGPTGVLVSMSRSMDRQGIFNAVVAEGEAADGQPPVRAIAYDVGPNSPTYWYGRFGKLPRRYSSSLLTRQAQAEQAAVSLLSRSLGAPYSVSFGAVPNPALEPNDPILITYADESPAEHHVVQTLDVGLGEGDTMTGTTREVSNVVVDVTDGSSVDPDAPDPT